MPTFDLTDDELAAGTAAIRRAIETDRFPRAPRLDPAPLGPRQSRTGDGPRANPARQSHPKAPPRGMRFNPEPGTASERQR
jgi:hypothetical protein